MGTCFFPRLAPNTEARDWVPTRCLCREAGGSLKWFAQQISELYRVRKAALASILRQSRHGVRLNEHLQHGCGLAVFQHACKMGLEGIVTKRLGSRYRSGRSPDSQVQESGCSGREAGGRRGLEQRK
jgi:hypothetical protein